MVQLQQYLTNKSDTSSDSSMPLLNSLFVQNFSAFSTYGSDQEFKTFMKWARKSPHLIGFLNVIATDILSDNISFEPMVNTSSGRNKVIKAENFWKLNKGLDVAEETIYDMLINGIGYNWVGKINEVQLKEFCGDLATKLSEGKEFEIKANDIYDKVTKSEEISIAQKLRHVAATTVSIQADEVEMTGFVQRVGANYKMYDIDEMIVFKLMPLDGQLYPFPPMEAILTEIYLIWLISQNYVSFFENGGHPDKVFTLPKEIANSKNHRYLIKTLRKYKKIQNKHGNLVFTGDLKIDDLMKVESAMEHKDLGLYVVGVLAMFYGIPAGRIPFLIGKAANNGDAGGLADSGYWRKISVWQSKIEAPYNRELWNPYFGVNMKFARGYKQDEVRETSTEMQKNNIVEQRLEMGLWTVEAAGKYLKIDEEILQEAQKQKKEREEEAFNSHMQNQNMTNKDDANFESDKKLKNKKKQTTQLQNNTNAGGKNINP